ncbi:uncharacterized protein LOC132255625 isoform X2 [Phlebotomus argentipes]|uniref:uncharacterized protein LOC132255625 isoform X2 n=1 Tax=Phlebotomus argentipes TaxID=94469 RepID=UPI002893260A|nr:uncharacterized protein LOC132255625 isoform X2 [Phlebotomus argentipes]
MSKDQRSESVKVVCSINPSILKQLGLDGQIKSALAKASKPRKLTQKVCTAERKEEVVAPQKKILVIKQETVDSNLATEILQTLPKNDRITNIIEGRLKGLPESKHELPEAEGDVVLEEIWPAQEQEYVGEVVEFQDNFYQPEIYQDGEVYEYVIEHQEEIEEPLQENSQDIQEVQEVVIEEKINSDSEDSFLGFCTPAENPEENPLAMPKSQPRLYRSLSDTIATVRSRMSIHREAKELAKSLVRIPESPGESEESAESAETSEEEESFKGFSEESQDGRISFLFKYMDKERVIKDILALKRNSLDGMMDESFEDSDEENPTNPSPGEPEGEEDAGDALGSAHESPREDIRHSFIITEIEDIAEPHVVKSEQQEIFPTINPQIPMEEEVREPEIETEEYPEIPEIRMNSFSTRNTEIPMEKEVREPEIESEESPDVPVVRVKMEKTTEDNFFLQPEEPSRSTRSRGKVKLKDISVFQETRRISRRSLKSQEAPDVQAAQESEAVEEIPVKRKAELMKQEPKRQKVSKIAYKTVICGRCQASVASNAWYKHLLTHNGVAWKESEEQPIDFHDDDVRAKVIQNFMRKHRLSQVRCEKCKDVRKSGVGLVSHERTCGKSSDEVKETMTTCEHCSKRVLPCSLKTHLANHCSVLRKLQASEASEKQAEQLNTTDTEAEYSAAGRLKRKSKRVAEAKFRRDLSPDDSEPFTRSDSDASIGMESSDSDGSSGVSEISEGNPSDSEEGSRSKTSKKRRLKKKSSLLESRNRTLNDSMRKAYTGRSWSEWRAMSRKDLMLYYKSNIDQFRSINHKIDPIFTDWMPKILPTADNEVFRDYLPKSTTSISYDQHKVANYKVSFGGASSRNMSTLERFEGVCDGTNPPIFYCGAPILSLDWLPCPPEAIRGDIVAISCASSFRKHYEYSHGDAEKTTIQIWSVESDNVCFLYGIAYDWGPVFCLKFCPSGGFSPAGRLGLLAASSCNGKIAIFALPMPPLGGKVVKLPPSVMLESRQESLVTRVAWSEMTGHNYVAAGLSSGRVYVWKLDVESRLLKRQRPDRQIIYPNRTIYAHLYPVTALIFGRLEDRNLLLMGSVDKTVKIFDVIADAEISTLACKSQITCAAWPLNWPMYVYGIDNSYQWNRTEVQLKQPFNIPYEDATLIVHTQDITDLSLNEWRNALIISTESGDICANLRPFYSPLSKKSDLMRRIIGYTDSIQITETNSAMHDEESLNYSSENCGIIFCDFQREVDLKATKAHRTRHIADYPLTKINRVVFNPNERNHTLYAIGYQAGFVRVCGLGD